MRVGHSKYGSSGVQLERTSDVPPGRMLAYCDFSRQGVLAEHGNSEGWSFDVLSILAGTAVSLLFPWGATREAT